MDFWKNRGYRPEENVKDILKFRSIFPRLKCRAINFRKNFTTRTKFGGSRNFHKIWKVINWRKNISKIFTHEIQRFRHRFTFSKHNKDHNNSFRDWKNYNYVPPWMQILEVSGASTLETNAHDKIFNGINNDKADGLSYCKRQNQKTY